MSISALLLCLTYSGEAHLRLIKAITPYSDPYTYGYPSVLNREMMYTARFIGEGGAGSLGFADAVVPKQGNEWFMLPYFAHRFGWIVPAAVVALFAALTALMLRGIRRQSSVLGGLTGFAIVMCFVIRAAFYFLTSFGMVLFEAEGLPLFSSCGKLAILDMFMLGVLLSVFRTGDITRDSRVSQTE